MSRFTHSSSMLLVGLAGIVSAQRARFAAGEIDREKPVLLGVAGSMLPAGDRLGPVGDVDADGDVDLLVDGRTYLNDGAGTFRAWRNIDVADEHRVAFLHADADPHLDLLTEAHLYFGDGSGGFEDASANLPAGFRADVVAIGDFDRDGDLDLAVVDRTRWSVQLLRNDGSGAFVDASVFLPPAPSFPRTLAAGDLDGDGDLELVVASFEVAVWRNGADGFAEVRGAVPDPGLATSAVVLADVDGDADLDLVLGGTDPYGFGAAVWLENVGGPAFGAATAISIQGRPAAILAFDCEGDGDQDLVFVEDTSVYGMPPYTYSGLGAIELRVNEGGGTFRSASLPGHRGVYRTGYAADVDGDGDLDLAFEDDEYSSVLLLGDGQGTFGATVEETYAPGSFSVALGDLDGDGLLDAFTPTRVSINGPPGDLHTTGRSTPRLETACEWDPLGRDVAGHSALGDVDGDGDLDAYIAGRGMGECPGPYQQSNRLWVNDGSGWFTDETRTRLPIGGYVEVAGSPRMVALVELDGDGDLDAACVRSPDYDFSGYSSCYLNDGSGVFARKEQIGSRSYAAGFDDLDGDGDVDFFEGACSYYTRNGVHLNDGLAHFVPSSGAVPDHDIPMDANGVAITDIDRDGDLDVYVSVDRGSRPSFVYVNDGTARFSDEPERIPASVPGYVHALAFVDIDLDGDPDLASAGGLFVNDGTGVFDTTPSHAERYGFGEPAMAVGDVDLDGDSDLVLLQESVIAASFARHLESLGPARVGKRQTLVVHGSPRTPYTLLESLGMARIPLGPQGFLLVDPTRLLASTAGLTDGRGEAVVRRIVPAIPALVGHETFLQAFVGQPPHGTNLVVSRITGL